MRTLSPLQAKTENDEKEEFIHVKKTKAICTMEKGQGSRDSCKSCKHKRANRVGMRELDRGEEDKSIVCTRTGNACGYLPETNERHFRKCFLFNLESREIFEITNVMYCSI